MSSLKELKIGDETVISGYSSSNKAYREKLLSMGLTKGTKLKLLKYAPMGDPVEIEVRGYKLSLRKEEAEILILGDKNE